MVERRYLSLRDARPSASASVVKGEEMAAAEAAAMGSGGTRGAEQGCAALSLERDMVAIGAASQRRVR